VGNLQQLRIALTVDNVNDVNHGTTAALHYAAHHGHAECVKLCLEMGANVNARASHGSCEWNCYCSLIVGCRCNR
jgi:ankyrin repeat protein